MFDKEKQAELARIREQGFQIMQYGNLPLGTELIIHLWQYGLYKNYTVKAWSLYTKFKDKTVFARRYRWQHIGKKMITTDGTNRPDIQTHDIEPDQDRVIKLIHDGNSVQIPFVGIRPNMGKDGGFRGLCTPSVSGIPNCISWWARPPVDWEQLDDWVSRMFRFLDSQKLK